MVGNKKITMIRYVTIIGFLASLAVFKKDNIDFFCILLAMLFLLNNQIRFFFLKRKDMYMLLSICVELLLLSKLYADYGGILFFCYFPVVFDSALLIKSRLSYLGLALATGVSLIGSNNANYSELFAAVGAYFIFFVLAQHIKDEHERKLEAQGLYDKLRISEEKLKKANSDLEIYANSIEELTLLRERNRISREIHDSVGHSLSTLIIQLGAIEKIAMTNGVEASAMAKSLGAFAKDSLNDVRRAVRELKPDEFDENEGLLALQELITKFEKFTGVEIKFGFSKEHWGLSPDKSLVAYRAVQEFLSNAVRHGKATKASIHMNFSKENLIITMQDNGIGAEKIVEGVGLKSIAERTREQSGNMMYSSEAGKGFFLKLVLPKQDKLFMPEERN